MFLILSEKRVGKFNAELALGVGCDSGVADDFANRLRVCRSLLQDIKSPLLDDRKTSDEFRSAWERIHNDKFNEVSFMMFDQNQTIMNQHEPN